MAVDEVLQRVGHFRGVDLAVGLESPGRLAGGDLVVAVPDPLERDLRERIVHDRVEGPAIEPFGLRLPDLADDVGVGVDRADEFAPLDPERHRDLLGDVQPPAVDPVRGIAVPIGVHPSTGDGEDVVAEGLRGEAVLLALAERGKLAEAGPAVVFERVPVPDAEPVGVRGLHAAFTHVDERGMGGADVVEDAVDDHLESPALRLLEEVEEDPVALRPGPGRRIEEILAGDRLLEVGFARPEVLVDVPEVGRVVLVVRARLEDRVEVERVHAERLEVRQPLTKALDVAAVVPVEHEVLVEGLAVRSLPGTRVVPGEGPWADGVVVVRRIAVAEALDHHLVPDGVLRPVGRADLRDVRAVEAEGTRMAHPGVSVLEDERVGKTFAVGRQARPPAVESVRAAGRLQRESASVLEDDPRPLDVAAKRPDRDLESILRERLEVPPVGRIMAEGDAQDLAVSSNRSIGADQGILADREDGVLTAVAVGHPFLVEGIRHPVAVVADELVVVGPVVEREDDRPPAEGVASHLAGVGIPPVEGPGESHSLRGDALDGERGPPTTVRERDGTNASRRPHRTGRRHLRDRHVGWPRGRRRRHAGGRHRHRQEEEGRESHGQQL